MTHRFESVQSVRDGLKAVNYLADEGIAGVAFLADRLGKPVLVEGPAGTGKTQLAKSIAEMTGAKLIRLQCYEGLDESKALYEWNYKKQLLRIQADRGSDSWDDIHDDIFGSEFLLTRPVLEAITSKEPVVLLIDEVDRVEVETEALLLEILSEYQVSIPELGTIEATNLGLIQAQADAVQLNYDNQIKKLEAEIAQTTNKEKQLKLEQDLATLSAKAAGDAQSLNEKTALELDAAVARFQNNIQTGNVGMFNDLARRERAYFVGIQSTITDSYKGTGQETMAQKQIDRLAGIDNH